jgi:hypothetical protein
MKFDKDCCCYFFEKGTIATLLGVNQLATGNV